jgi:acetyl esterase/lipase
MIGIKVQPKITQAFLGSPFDLFKVLILVLELIKNYEVIEGLIYKNTTNYSLYYDVHIPKQPSIGQNRTIIYIHGGGWTSGSRRVHLILKLFLRIKGILFLY